MSLITVIIPAYNEEKNILLIATRLIEVLETRSYELELIFINDGSKDNSEEVLKMLSNRFANVYFINFSRNFGQQNALRAGYDYSTGDAVICMDADLQNPPELVLELIKKWEEGFDVVLCRRRKAKQHGGFLKEITSKFFYRLLTIISDTPIEHDSPDFRLIDRKLVNIIKNLPENDIFLRGLISWMGFQKTVVEYNHGLRINGNTSYSLPKMIKLATSGITSFSVKPLHIAIYLGLFISCLSLSYIPYVFVKFFYGHTISGWASLIVTVSFLGGLQLLILGIIGLYLGKLFIQNKQRPEYIVKSTNMDNKINLNFELQKGRGI
ncbi:glycosyltransferase family 2 protein [Pedobacter sp. V48]|uniref:glycosyltransferase family 2 protein n=1 Tax=Pedobacter sp. V48 TaxID=509635 RepID=UPI0003E4EFCA|nr:glycosyltransferase family 2 protein [Pedobacter sp. V48]ETZ23812.1 bactoprenol glucosyl transferase [Pedobacter sp. V48]